ncbi:response regulator transcription factor [Nocardia sp. NPDC004123]
MSLELSMASLRQSWPQPGLIALSATLGRFAVLDDPLMTARVFVAVAEGARSAGIVGDVTWPGASVVDAVRAGLRAGMESPSDGHRRADYFAALTTITEIDAHVERQSLLQRLLMLQRVEEALGRLGGAVTSSELIAAAPREFVRSCGLTGAVMARVEKGRWYAESVWFPAGPDHDEFDAPPDGGSLPRSGDVPPQVLRERKTVQVRVHGGGWLDGVELVAPICSDDRVAGVLLAAGADDCFARTGHGRTVCDAFVRGLGLLMEKVATGARLREQRERVVRVLQQMDDDLSGGLPEPGLERYGRRTGASDGRRAPVVRAVVAGSPPLSARERDVAELLVAGLTNRQIAEELYIGVETVKSHVQAVIRKLRACGRADAVSRYLKAGRS